MLLVNIYPDIMMSIEESSNGVGGLLHYFYLLDEWSILPSLIFMGVGAMTDFGPLIANPSSFLLGAAAQFGILVPLISWPSLWDSMTKLPQLSPSSEEQTALLLFPGWKAGTDRPDGTDCRCRILLHGSGADYPAADYEALHHRGGEKDQDGAASSGIQAGEDPVPNRCNK